MRLFYITFSIRGKSGLERMIVLKANYFAEHYNYDVHIITVDDYFESSFYPLHKDITHHDLKLRGTNFLAKSKEINKVLNAEGPDVVLVAMDSFPAAFQPMLLDKKFPMVLERHSIMIGQNRGDESFKAKSIKKIKKSLMKIGAKSYDRLVVLSEGGIEEWGNSKNTLAINNPITFPFEKSADLSSKKVLAVGRYSYTKGFDMLLKIWKIASSKFPEWELNIYGDGVEQKNLEKTISELNLEESVKLKPPTKNISKVYLDSSIYTLTSRDEGFGLVLVEAMSSGLPVLAFDCPTGPKDIITDNEDGFLIPVGDISTYAEKLMALMESQELREVMGKAGLKNSNRFSQKQIMAQWDSLFKELAS